MTPQIDDSDQMIGEIVGSYRITERVGSGGMGAVYAAEHVLLGRRAAVKVLLPERSTNPEILERFFNEAKAASLIQHPGIVDIFDYGQLADGNAYIVMEYLEGESLGDRLKREGRLSASQAASIARHIAGTLAAAHDHGIIHRDLKPDNVFLSPDPAMPRGERAKLLDFGIAKLQTTSGDLVKTETGRLMGTPYYMSPEQCRGAGKVDHRTDIYSLGCVLYQMLTGRPPFVLEGAGEILAAHIYEPAKPPRKLEPSIPTSLEKVVMRLIEKDLARRYGSMTEVVTALNEAVGRFAGEETPEPSLAESDKFQTQRTPKLRFASDADTIDSQDAYVELEVRSAPRRRRWLAWLVPPTTMVAAILVWVLWPTAGPATVADPAVVTPLAPRAATTAPVEARPPTPPPPSEPQVRALVVDAGPTLMAESEMVMLSIGSQPDGAMVYRELDGVKLGKTPLVLPVMRGRGEADFVLKKSGYHTERVSFPVDVDQERVIVLRVKKSGEHDDVEVVPTAGDAGSGAGSGADLGSGTDAVSGSGPGSGSGSATGTGSGSATGTGSGSGTGSGTDPKKGRGKDDAIDPFKKSSAHPGADATTGAGLVHGKPR